MHTPQAVPVQRLNRLAWLLDNSIRVPGTRFRIGLDPLIGLLPGIGEAIGGLLSMYIIVEGARGGLPRSVLLRMGVNVALEMLLGSIPLAGDLFDMAWKANARNARLIEKYVRSSRKTTVSSTIILWSIVGVLTLLTIGLIFVGVMILKTVGAALTS